MMTKLTPDALEDRLIEFGSAVCVALRRLPKGLIGSHLCRQLVRSATSPAADYAEARGAESRRDFVHNMQLCLKELRESLVWLRLLHRLGGMESAAAVLAAEYHELIAVFVRSINTAKRPTRRPSRGAD